eukprot:SAG31_NODE_23703_length_498_cov_0.912281_1_plen_29_part_10
MEGERKSICMYMCSCRSEARDSQNTCTH